jgi:hypothetical protein
VTFLASRLNRLTPALTAKERAILILRAQSQGVDPDPDILRTMPAEQRHEYDRYVGLDYVTNFELNALGFAITRTVELLQHEHERLALLELAASTLETDYGEKVDPAAVRHWRKQKTISVPLFLRGLFDELRVMMLQNADQCWREMRALEIVWAEVGDEFDGVDPVHPDLRSRLSETREALGALMEQLAGPKKRKRPEPDGQLVGEVRKMIDQAFEKLGLLKRAPTPAESAAMTRADEPRVKFTLDLGDPTEDKGFAGQA